MINDTGSSTPDIDFNENIQANANTWRRANKTEKKRKEKEKDTNKTTEITLP